MKRIEKLRKIKNDLISVNRELKITGSDLIKTNYLIALRVSLRAKYNNAKYWFMKKV